MMASSPQKSPSSPTPLSPSFRKKDETFLGKLGGTLVRRKKAKEDIVNCDLKSTLRVLYNLFTRYRHVD
ncbi:Alpha-parvin [Bagarius yarrelli]|uniref:Alpha-parvin n=1 Tax=Bagarius yarrelli TaxID=175774 RepID=A0A556V137_BAGYA|nr:Alpha-parvin [Bagarius yarrelli]